MHNAHAMDPRLGHTLFRGQGKRPGAPESQNRSENLFMRSGEAFRILTPSLFTSSFGVINGSPWLPIRGYCLSPDL
jgi:hypothetical protein